jgi:hypothetical protein
VDGAPGVFSPCNMSLETPVFVSSDKELEERGKSAVREALRPWVCTWTGQTDMGRDGFVEVADRAPQYSHAVAADLSFSMQLKSTRQPIGDSYSETFETRHFALWAGPASIPTLLIVWSEASGEIRARSAREILEELDASRPGWRQQATVSVEFSAGHRLAPADIRRRLSAELDRDGGLLQFNRNVRRVVLTRFFRMGETHATSMHLELEGTRKYLVGGEGWTDGDLDIRDVDAVKTLSTALLLFEEVWLPKDHAELAIKTLGTELAARLLDFGRIRFWALREEIWFAVDDQQRRGRLERIVHRDISPDDVQNRWAKTIAASCGQPSLWRALTRATRTLPSEFSETILTETARDLGTSQVRTLLGLPPASIPGTEAGWDAYMVNRLARVNTAHRIGRAFRADVVEHELGLSRIAAEKWYDSLEFHRIFHSTAAFAEFLDGFSLPEFGLIANAIGMESCAELAASPEGQQFRDWFWENASTDETASQSSGKRLVELAPSRSIDPRMLAVPTSLKIKIFNANGQLCPPGRPGVDQPGLFFRGHNAELALGRQVANYKAGRRKRITEILGTEPEPYAPCPCRSGEKYKFCHGAK